MVRRMMEWKKSERNGEMVEGMVEWYSGGWCG